MKKPEKVVYNERGTTSLYFGAYEYTECYVRGAVCWPEKDQLGFALLGCQDIKTKKIRIYEQTNFLTIENILNEDQQFESYGLLNFFNKGWARYYAEKYFWNQSKNLHKMFRTEVSRSWEVKPKPIFVRIDSADGGIYLIENHLTSKKLTFDEGSELHNQLKLLRTSEGVVSPAARALGTLLEGYARWPFRRHNVTEVHQQGYDPRF